MSVFIRQLTGIRFIAAAWVLLYHVQGPLEAIGVLAIPGVADVIRVGGLGVDLFFGLSGFILTHTYLSRLGTRFRGRAVLVFLWLRLARVYPVHVAMIVVTGCAVVLQAKLSGDSAERDWLNPLSLLRNLALLQEWGPSPDHGWNFVAWSLSMEWLAYLIFPVLVLLLWLLGKHVPTLVLAALWLVTLVPLIVYSLSTSDPYGTADWGSTYRVLTEFTAGAITYLIVSRLMRGGQQVPATPRVEGAADYLAILLPALVVVGAVVLGHLPRAQPPDVGGSGAAPPYFQLLLVPFLIAWIGALAISRRGLTRILATRTLVFGGFISYSLYMTHLVWIGVWRAAMNALHLEDGPAYAAGVVGLLVGALVIAWLMWKLVEEPARERLRALAGARRLPTEEAGEAMAERRRPLGSADPVVLAD